MCGACDSGSPCLSKGKQMQENKVEDDQMDVEEDGSDVHDLAGELKPR